MIINEIKFYKVINKIENELRGIYEKGLIPTEKNKNKFKCWINEALEV